MFPTLGNPLGLLALLGIPAVLAIHFLQRKARELPVSTLFLLEQTRRDAASGRRFERLIPSIPLWMQLLAVLLLAWLLADPRYRKSGTVQRVAIVLDSSASMGVFKTPAVEALESLLPTLQGPAGALELTLLESIPNRPRLYAGSDSAQLVAAIDSWLPSSGPVDPTAALRLARSLVSREGSVIYLTDTPATALPFGAKALAIGKPIDNVGFTGVGFSRREGALVWEALVKNHGRKTARRSWNLQSASGSSTPRPIELEPGALVRLQAAFPEDARNLRIVLSADGFPLDDTLPLVAPRPKLLSLFTTTSVAASDLTSKLLRALDAVESAPDASTADLSIASYDPLDPTLPTGNAILFVKDETRTGTWLKGGIIAEPHPLLDGLNWQTLLARETIQLERLPTDQVLLWQDERPLIFLRESESARQLLFNFDPSLSNALKQPALIVLLHRFAESIRSAKIAPVAANLETGEALELTTAATIAPVLEATAPDGEPLPPAALAGNETAIHTPGFMTVRQGETTLLTAAVHFGDPREADLSKCAAAPLDDASQSAALERHTRPDPLWRIWLLVLMLALIISWHFTAPKLTPDHQRM